MKHPNLAGLPEYGVTLSGIPDAPIIANQSDRRIIGYVLCFEDAAGNKALWHRMLSLLALRNGLDAGIPPGGERTFSSNTQVRLAGQTETIPKVAATLDAVLFADGELVGPDRSNAFDDISAQIKAEQDLDNQLLRVQGGTPEQIDAAWSAIALVAEGGGVKSAKTPAEMIYASTQRIAASELIRVRSAQGEDAAYALAGRSAVYPTIWRKE